MILEKLDGSMIAPFMLNGKVVWGTKMGLTDVATPVQEFVDKHPEYEAFAHSMINNLQATPIFEWCSRQQRIVLDYPEERLVLTGLRKITSGEYYPHNNFAFFAMQHGIPVVKIYEGGLDSEFIASMKERQDIEGFVIVFEDGNRLKIKCDWYCQLHQVKAAINQERNVADMILNHKLDDLKSLLPKEDLDRLNSYELAFHSMMVYNVDYIGNVLDYINSTGMTRKYFALNFSTMNNLEKWATSTIFKCWEDCGNEAIYKQIKEYILKNCGRNVRFDEMRKDTSLFRNVPEWKQLMFDTAEEIV
jgi:RNA ligase